MFGSAVECNWETGELASNRSDMYNSFGIAGTRFADFAVRDWIQPPRYCQLGRSNRVGQIDIEDTVMTDAGSGFPVHQVLGCAGSWRDPEVRPMRLEYAGSGTYLKSRQLQFRNLPTEG